MDYWNEANRLLHVSMDAVSKLLWEPNIIEVLAKTAPAEEKAQEDPEKHRLELEEAQNLASFAQKEIDSGFPLLHAHTLVGAWGAMEATIEDMLVGMLMNEPELLQKEAFAKVRIPLADFEALEKEERMRLLVEEIDRAQNSGRKQGIERFEGLLDRFDLSGSVNAQIRKDVWEMNHVRNVLVHRRSLADRRLVQACPWMGLKVGDRLVITHKALYRYAHALYLYVINIQYRLGDKYGVDLDAKIDEEFSRRQNRGLREDLI